LLHHRRMSRRTARLGIVAAFGCCARVFAQGTIPFNISRGGPGTASLAAARARREPRREPGAGEPAVIRNLPARGSQRQRAAPPSGEAIPKVYTLRKRLADFHCDAPRARRARPPQGGMQSAARRGNVWNPPRALNIRPCRRSLLETSLARSRRPVSGSSFLHSRSVRRSPPVQWRSAAARWRSIPRRRRGRERRRG
jgi:hypothetical protein